MARGRIRITRTPVAVFLLGLLLGVVGCGGGGGGKLDGTVWWVEGSADILRLDPGGVAHLTLDAGPSSRPTYDGKWEKRSDGTIKLEFPKPDEVVYHIEGKVEGDRLNGESWVTGGSSDARKKVSFRKRD